MPIETSHCQFTPASSTSARLYLALELSHREWKLAFSAGLAVKARIRSVPADDLARLREEIARARKALALAPEGRQVTRVWKLGLDALNQADVGSEPP